ncbi:MAG: flagellar assembly protein FliH [Spirochaetaceae bacterium]|nr:flagellar assembly protein FliH [Spirochaetaceae bacterium]
MKAVFRPEELVNAGTVVSLEAPFAGEAEDVPETAAEFFPAFEGPTADDLRREAEEFKAQWASEKEAMISSARSEAEIIVTAAKKMAEEEAERLKEELDVSRAKAQEEAEAIVSEARTKAEEIEAGASAKLEESLNASAAQGFDQGHKDGYEAGMADVRRLVSRTQLIMERIQDKRLEIMEQAEQEMIDLTLLVARKVVKAISESGKQVVVENIKEALGKVKTRGRIIVKVNLSDLDIASSYLDEFVKLMEGSGGIQILEDSSVDSGGCYIETDFGEIDARIAVQFAELESKILELSPFKKVNAAASTR